MLMASGYIAGGAIAGIFIALLAGVFPAADGQVSRWAAQHNPLFNGDAADALSLLPFVVLTSALWLVARTRVLRDEPKAS